MKKDPETENQNPAPWFRIWAELAGAWAVAVAHPLYVAIASGPEALTSYGLRRLDLLALIVIVSLVGPLVLSLFELLLRKLASERVRLGVHGVLIGALLSVVIWDWLTDNGHAGLSRDILPLLFAGGFAWLFFRFELIRNFVLMFSAATVVVIGAFALSYPIWSTLGPHESGMDAQENASDTPVVMVIFDELPLAALEDSHARIDAKHFPTFGEIAATSTWYPETTAVGDQTVFAVPSLMTGNDPTEEKAERATPPGLPDYPDNICAILDQAGYQVHAYEPVTDLCARSYDFGTRISGTLGRATEWTDPGFTLNPAYLSEMLVYRLGKPFDRPYNEYDSDRPLAVGDFVEGMPSSDRAISVLHIALPHVRWMYQPDGTAYPNLRSPEDDQLNSPATRGENSRDMQMMMLQLAYADQQLKRVTDRMKELGIWEKSLFVVTADHGGAFNRSGSRRILTDENAGWVLPVPLLIKSPGQTKAKVVRGPADSRDIAPTMLGALGLEPGDEATGRDLTGLDRLPPRDTVEARGVFGKVDFDRSTIVKEHAKARDYRNQLFPGSLYAVGGHENLIGQKPVGLRRLGFEIVFPENYTDVVTEGGYVPSWVQGSLTDVGQPPPESVAVALNGEIIAIAPVWTTAGVAATGVIVPGRDFVDGANEIAVYEIPGSQAKGG